MPIPRRDNYDFEGWYTEKGTNGINIANIVVTDNITVYARWRTSDWRTELPSNHEFNVEAQFRVAYKEHKTVDTEILEGWNFERRDEIGRTETITVTYDPGTTNGRIITNIREVPATHSYHYGYMACGCSPVRSDHYTSARGHSGCKAEFVPFTFSDPLTSPVASYTVSGSTIYEYRNPSGGRNIFYVPSNISIVNHSQNPYGDLKQEKTAAYTEWIFTDPIYTYVFWRKGSFGTWLSYTFPQQDNQYTDSTDAWYEKRYQWSE